MKCVVSGATGFIGRALSAALRARGDQLMATSHSGATLPDGTPTLALDLTAPSFEALPLNQVETLFHLAGVAHQRADTAHYYALNHRATLDLASSAEAAGVRRFIYISSVKAMGPPPSVEARTEEQCYPPQDDYGHSKWLAECDLRQQFADSRMSIVIVRPAVVIDPFAKGNVQLLQELARYRLLRPPALGRRSWVALDDLVSALLALAHAPLPAFVSTWIACANEPCSTRELYDAMRCAQGRSPGQSVLPALCWHSLAASLDVARGQVVGTTAAKLFGTECYNSSALQTLIKWQPRVDLATAVRAPASVAPSCY